MSLLYNMRSMVVLSFPGGSVVKNLPASAEDLDLIPGSGRSPGGEHGNLLQYPCLENPMDKGAWWVTVHRASELDTTETAEHSTAYSTGKSTQYSALTYMRKESKK